MNKGFLAIIALAVLGVFAFVAYEEANDTPLENAAESVSDTAEDLGDSVEDATDN